MTRSAFLQLFSVFATLALAIGALGSGCRQVVGIEDREVSEAASRTLFPACELAVRGSDCAECMANNCCNAATQCSKNPDCQRDNECVQECASGDSACQHWCAAEGDPNNPILLGLESCRQAVCAERCGAWACLEQVNWRVLSSMPLLIRVAARVVDAGGEAVDGVQVRVCWASDPACGRGEVASGETNELGLVELVFDPAVQGTSKPASVFLEFKKEGFPDHLLMLTTPPLSFDFDVEDVSLDSLERVEARGEAIAEQHQTSFDPDLAMVKLRVQDCNLQPTNDVAVSISDAESQDEEGWNLVAVNVPVPENLKLRVVARRDDPSEPVIAVTYLVVRPGAVTLALFVPPTP